MADELGGNSALQRTAEVASEYFIPGGANLIKGDLISGAAHLAAGVVAKAVFGVPGILLVHANSLMKARTGQNLYNLLGGIQFAPPAAPTVKSAK
jgi:hypothetical protein